MGVRNENKIDGFSVSALLGFSFGLAQAQKGEYNIVHNSLS